MFRHLSSPDSRCNCFPRTRGDVPSRHNSHNSAHQFSPYTRGCSGSQKTALSTTHVFPVHAGMFLPHAGGGGCWPCFPRTRGDVPGNSKPNTVEPRFSPYTRGCSGPAPRVNGGEPVFPVHAGMFHFCTVSPPASVCFPRTRGDVPYWRVTSAGRPQFSPYTRGCSGGRASQRHTR